eukprot:c9598_g1_i5.p1 GENE.c9598_g1_i5~~c9598_g1_i5.p1  ORF type:complete len:343 (-),score=71.19 c9598_g1_i5:238-1266(-)
MSRIPWEEWLCFVLFTVSSLLCFGHIVSGLAKKGSNRSLRYGVESATRVKRWTFRTWFQGLLLLSNTARAICTLLEVYNKDRYTNNLSSWKSYLFRGIPSLFFFSTYSMIILFWAHLIFLTTNHRIQLLRPAFGVFNILAYALFIIVGVVTAVAKDYDGFWEIDLVVNIVLYGIGLLVALTYTAHILPRVLHSRRVANPKSAEHQIITQIVRLLFVCVCVFGVRVVWSFAIILALQNEKKFRDFGYDLFTLVLVEFIPTLIILVLIRKRHPDTHHAQFSQHHNSNVNSTTKGSSISRSKLLDDPRDNDLMDEPDRAYEAAPSLRHAKSRDFVVFVPNKSTSE